MKKIFFALLLWPSLSHAISVGGKDYDVIFNPYGGHKQYTTALTTSSVVGASGVTITTTSAGVSISVLTSTSATYVLISTNGTVQSGTFNVAGGTFTSAGTTPVSIISQTSGFGAQTFANFYTGTSSLIGKIGYDSTNSFFGILNGSDVRLWGITSGFFPSRLAMRIYNVGASNYVSFRSSDTTDNQDYVLPSSTGSLNQLLGINSIQPPNGGNEGIVTLSWQDPRLFVSTFNATQLNGYKIYASTGAIAANTTVAISMPNVANIFAPIVSELEGVNTAACSIRIKNIFTSSYTIYNADVLNAKNYTTWTFGK